MPSHLRLQSSFDTQSTQSYFPTASPVSLPPKKQKMSLTQTYRVASSARAKLGREAARADHDLRLLVGHANLLDSLMIELADAEREQESWFNETLRNSNPAKPESPRHIQWIDTIAEEDEEEDSDSDSDYSDDDAPEFVTRRRSVSPPPSPYNLTVLVEEDEEEDFEDFENDAEHTLTRVESHPPELIHEDEDSDDESMPPSPTSIPEMTLGGKQASVSIGSYFPKVPRHDRPESISANLLTNERPNNQMIAVF